MIRKKVDHILVLRQFRYADNAYIVDAFAREAGKISFSLRTSARKKSKERIRLQPPNFVEVEYLESVKFHPRIIQSHLLSIYREIPFDLRKTAVSVFITEILQTLIGDEKDRDLFQKLYDFFEKLDRNPFNPDFHLEFLKFLTAHAGILPGEDKKGMFFAYENPGEKNFSLDNLHKYWKEGKTGGREQRRRILEEWLQYFAWHVEGFRKPQSLKVYDNIF
jgi:DNA repair protein RecO (recombination protein O)